MSDQPRELAIIDERLAAIETVLGVGTRSRWFRFSLQALFCLVVVAAALSFATVEHLKTKILEVENAKLEAEKARLQANVNTLTSNLEATFQQYARSEGRSRMEEEERKFEAAIERYNLRREILTQGSNPSEPSPEHVEGP